MTTRVALMELELGNTGVRGVSGDEFDTFADGLDGELTPQTHEENLNLPNRILSMSVTERLRLFAKTRLGRLSMFAVTMLPPATLAAACGNEGGGEAPTPGIDRPTATAGANGVGGGNILTDGDVIIITREGCVVTPDAASIDAYAALSAEDQEDCQEDIANLTAEQVEKLSPLSRARWMAYYRLHKLKMPGLMLDLDLKSFESVLKQKDSLNGMAAVFLQLQGNNTAAMAWFLQKGEQGKDPRTRWALFGVGADEDDESVQNAKRISSGEPAGGRTLEQYINANPGNAALLYDSSTIADVTATQKPDGTWEYSFSAARPEEDGTKRAFRYTFIPFLADDPEALARGEIHEVRSPDSQFLGGNLAVLPQPA